MRAFKLIDYIFLSLFFLTDIAVTAKSVDSLSLDFIQENGMASVELISLGGHQEFCVELRLQNRFPDTLQVWIEPARILLCEDESMQDIIILRSELITLAPGSFKSKKLYGFCCRSDLASPRAGIKFRPGPIDQEHLVNLSKFIQNGTYDSGDVQSAVWVISNGHTMASICGQKEEPASKLKLWLSETINKPLPWYCIQYDLQDTSVFQNKHLRVSGDLTFRVLHYSTVTIQVRSAKGLLMQTVQRQPVYSSGEYIYPLDIDIKGWPKGQYEIFVFEDGNRLPVMRYFNL